MWVRRALHVRLTLSEDATLRIVVKRKGAKRPVVRTVEVRAGERALKLRLGTLRKGRYTVTLAATDATGNAAPPQLRRFRRR